MWVLSFSGVEVGKDQEFVIETKGAGGQGKLDVNISSPMRKAVPCLVEPVLGKECSTAKYIPREEGLYVVDVSYDGNPIPGSPYTVEATLPPDPSKVSECFGAVTVTGTRKLMCGLLREAWLGFGQTRPRGILTESTESLLLQAQMWCYRKSFLKHSIEKVELSKGVASILHSATSTSTATDLNRNLPHEHLDCIEMLL